MLTDKQLDSVLDQYNDNIALLGEAIASNNIEKHTVRHIKNQLRQALEDIKTQKYEVIRKTMYDIAAVIAL